MAELLEEQRENWGTRGGFILAEGALVDEGKPDNLRAVIAAASEYGVYK